MGNWLNQHYNEIFKKYTDGELLSDLSNFKTGGKCNRFLSHYFEEEIYKCCGSFGQVDNADFTAPTPYDFLNDDKSVEEAFRYMSTKPNFFNGDDITNLRSWFRNRRPRKVANFPIQECKKIYELLSPETNPFFETEVNIHDSSMGFGSRLTCALLMNKNYYGTDPNKTLYKQLTLASDFINKHFISGKKDIQCLGSEIFIPEWENKMDLSFTSPPYFNLEIYSNDESASTKNYDNYEHWLEYFVKPSIDNSIKYLKVNGKLAINIKNLSKKLPLFDDYVKIISEHKNMKREKDLKLKINSKSWNDQETFNEPIMVFKKEK